jgi:DUF4097 and DUF4098 domain-containing protein YvlB
MKKDLLNEILLVSLLCLLAVGVGSCISIGKAKYERTVQVSAPFSPGSNFTAQTHNGSITITGADIIDCNLTATIVGRAMTEEAAKKIAEQTTIKLVPSANKLTARIDKPTFRFSQSVSVSLDVTIPDNADLELTTHNGSIVIKNITGSLNCTTHNGKMTAEQVSGKAELHTHNGSVTCREISGDAKLKTHNGGVKVYYSQAATSVCDISLITHNGGVEIDTPKNFSGEVEASTHNGSINTELPITVKGKVSRRKLTGTIGTGQGKLYLETHNGSIKIK